MKPMTFVEKTGRMALILTAGVAASLAWASATAPKLAVIVKVDGALTNLASKDIKAIYLGDKSYQGSDKIEPLVNGQDSLSDLFIKKVLNKTKAQYTKIWNGKAFIDGLSAPPVLPASEDVIREVQKNENAIGFVPEQDLAHNKGVKIIYSVDLAENK
jgi:ABC-type phosphate transport system substrate-binding protein